MKELTEEVHPPIGFFGLIGLILGNDNSVGIFVVPILFRPGDVLVGGVCEVEPHASTVHAPTTNGLIWMIEGRTRSLPESNLK